MFDLFKLVIQFVSEAVYTYAASEQGSAELVAIADQAEALGIDIPFYTPSQPEQPAPSEGVDSAASFSQSGSKRHQ